MVQPICEQVLEAYILQRRRNVSNAMSQPSIQGSRLVVLLLIVLSFSFASPIKSCCLLLLENGLLDFDLDDVDRLLNRSNNLLKNDINSIVVFAFSGSLPKVLRVVIPAATVWLIIWVARFTRIS